MDIKQAYKNKKFKIAIVVGLILIVAYGPQSLAEVILIGAFFWGGYKLYMWAKRSEVQERMHSDKMQTIRQEYERIRTKEIVSISDTENFRSDFEKFKNLIKSSGLKRARNDKLSFYLSSLELRQQIYTSLEEILKGNIAPITNVPVLLESEEKAYYSANCTVLRNATKTVKKETIYLGSRIKIGGIPLYFGGGIPNTETFDTLEEIGKAELVVTDKRIIISGQKVSYVIPLKSIFDLQFVQTISGIALQIMYDGSYSGNIYRLGNPSKCLVITSWLLDSIKEEKTQDHLDVNLSPEKALGKLKDRIRENPEDAEAYYEIGITNLGMLESKDEKVATAHLEDAIKAFKEVVKLKPDYAEAHYNIGFSYTELISINKERTPEKIENERLVVYAEDAIKAFKEAIKLKPEWAEAYYSIGVSYIKLIESSPEILEKERAIIYADEAFKKAIKLKPDYAEAHYGLGYTMLMLMSIKKEDYPEIIEEAYKSLHEAIRLKPDFVEAHGWLGILYIEKGEKEKALIEYEYLKEKNPELAKSFFEQINKKFSA